MLFKEQVVLPYGVAKCDLFSATRPHSVGLATNDSPAGLAAYILEKFAMWSGCEMTDTATCLESRFSKDDLLTNVMIYWATHSIASSMRFYYEQMHSPYRHVSARLVSLKASESCDLQGRSVMS